MTTPRLGRHEFYETDDSVIISVFDRDADPAQVSVKFEPRKLSYTNGDKSVVLEPLKGQIDPETSNFTVKKVKVEIIIAKRAATRWGALVGDVPDPLANVPASVQPISSMATKKPTKNWEGITTNILKSEKEKTTEEDPNVGGDSTLNSFFQKIFTDADDDTKRAMMKSFQESGGTTLSTNWEEVKKGKVPIKPPAGAELKKWD
ncbi:hypothetical protein AX17_000132 [Amanita inopinata Kibby_2008]|nr:hypothetical protein AX17_000132 [Amanita inopinata Kibby_2008]